MKLISLIVLLLLLGCTPYVKAPSTDGSCRNDMDCSSKTMCYNPSECGNSPSGPVRCTLSDSKCHKICTTDADCPAEMTYCKNAPWSDMATFRLCFK
ncbi:MAG: hypothetical protein AABX70_04195 [Nanoarchaeota archaeon]